MRVLTAAVRRLVVHRVAALARGLGLVPHQIAGDSLRLDDGARRIATNTAKLPELLSRHKTCECGETLSRRSRAVAPVLANVLRPRISVIRLVDKFIRRFDPVANGVELTIQFIVRIYGHN